MKQLNEQEDYDNWDEIQRNNPDLIQQKAAQANQHNEGDAEMEIDDHIFCPTHIFMISVHEKGEHQHEKDTIEFVVKGDSNMQNLKITNMENYGDYTEVQIQQAKKLVEDAIKRSITFPSGCSFSLRDKNDASVEF